jgi:hypothetical protein
VLDNNKPPILLEHKLDPKTNYQAGRNLRGRHLVPPTAGQVQNKGRADPAKLMGAGEINVDQSVKHGVGGPR